MSKLSGVFGLGLLLTTVSVSAEEAVALKYHYSPGQVLRYEGKQSMKGESIVSGSASKFSAETSWLREWRVIKIEENGNVRLSVTNLRIQVETTGPDGKKTSLDTEKGEDNPLRDVVGKPLVEVVLSPNGQVVEMGEATSKAATPFVDHLRTQLIPLPTTAVAPATGWQQDLSLPLPPPVGEQGERVRLRQTFRLEKVVNSVAIINLETVPAEEIKDRALLARIAQFLPSGRIELDLSRGVVRSLELKLDQRVENFAGSDSVMHITGTYREVLKDDVAGSVPGRR